MSPRLAGGSMSSSLAGGSVSSSLVRETWCAILASDS